MAYTFQVAVDASQPHVLADWWADALGWDVEVPDEAFIRKMIAEGYAVEDDTVTHDGKLVWKEGSAISHPESAESGGSTRIYFQLVPEGRTCEVITIQHRAFPPCGVIDRAGAGASNKPRSYACPAHTSAAAQ